jgi:GDP-L-fucose synthase
MKSKNQRKVFVCGHNGMVGSAIIRKLKDQEGIELCTMPKQDLNLECQAKVEDYFKNNFFDEVYMCAAKVGGILANDQHPYDFIYRNIAIQNNVFRILVHLS